MNFFLTPFKLVAGLVGIFWMAIGGAWGWAYYERLPAGWPNYQPQIRCCLVVDLKGPVIHAPFAGDVTAEVAAPIAELADARAAAHQWHANYDTVFDAIQIQNASIVAQRAAGARSLARAEQYVRLWQASRQATARLLAANSGPIAGSDACSRYQSVDKSLLESLK